MRLRLEEREPRRAFWRGHFEVWRLSGLTQRDYCERHGLSLKNFGNWRAQLKREDEAGPKARWGRYPRLRPSSGPRSEGRSEKPPAKKIVPARLPVSAANGSDARRKFSDEAKRLIVEEACQPNISVSRVARRYGITTSLLFRWRQALGMAPAAEEGQFLPVTLAEEPLAEEVSTSSAPAAAPSIVIERPTIGIEIELVGGRRVRFDRDVDSETMKRVISALEAEAAP